jgi:hypothetical protein
MQAHRNNTFFARLAATAILALAVLLLPGTALAHGQLQSRSVELGSSLTNASNPIRLHWSSGTAGTVRGIRIQVCANSPSYSVSCAAPSGGFSASSLAGVGGSLSSGWSYSGSGNNATLTKASGDSFFASSAASVNIAGFINPSSIATFYLRVTTYSSTGLSTGSELDFGSMAVSTIRSITGSGSAAAKLVFRVANAASVNCDSQTDIPDPTDVTSDFVTLSPNPGSISQPSLGTAQFCVATNAHFGFVVGYHDAALGGPDKGFWNGTHEFPVANVFTSTPGTEQFGFNLRDNASPDFGIDPDGTGLVSDLTNPNYSTVDRFSYNDTGSSSTLAQKGGPNISSRYTISYLANISSSTPGGLYLAHQIFTCTATF